MTYTPGILTGLTQDLAAGVTAGVLTVVAIDGAGNVIPGIVDSSGKTLFGPPATLPAGPARWSVSLPPTDDATLIPTGFGYRATLALTNRSTFVAEFALASGATVDFADVYDPAVAPTFDPTLPYATVAALVSALAASTAAAATDATTKANAAQSAATSAAATDATSKVAAEATVRANADAALGAQDRLVAARNPDVLVVGAVTRDSNGAATSAPVVWPDGTAGTYTADTLSSAFPGAVDGYHITYGSPVTKTYTQPTITRDATTGAATTVPAIVVT